VKKGHLSVSYEPNKQGLCNAQNYCLALSLANLYVVPPDYWNVLLRRSGAQPNKMARNDC